MATAGQAHVGVNGLQSTHGGQPRGWVWVTCVALMVVSALALFPRIDGWQDTYSGRLLWAEDGPVFMAQAHSMGWRSLFEPYAGYLHLYPRSVAWLGEQFHLYYQPGIYFAGWLLGYLLSAFVLVRTARLHGAGWLLIGAMLVAIAFQPQNGEVLFTITNVQWVLGVSLFLIGISGLQVVRRYPWIDAGGMLVMSLTGPFSIFLVPVLGLKVMWFRDWNANKRLYLPVLIGAVVQLVYMVRSGRATEYDGVAPLGDFVETIVQVLTFGATDAGGYLAVAAFWGILLVGVWREEEALKKQYLLMFAAIVLLYAGVLYSVRISPLSAVVHGVGNRYSWIPYSILFFVAFVTVRGRWVMALLLAMALGAICAPRFQKMGNYDYGYLSLAKLTRWRALDIPINPGHVWAHGEPERPVPAEQMPFARFDFRVGLRTTMKQVGEFEFIFDGQEPTINFGDPVRCTGATDVAVEIDMTRVDDGPMQLFWNNVPGFVEERSIRRWYKEGKVHVVLGFPVTSDTLYLRLDPMDGPGKVMLHDVKAYCLR